MSAFDLLIMGFFFAVVLLSFLGGFDKVLSILAGLYIGAIIAARTYVILDERVMAKIFPAMATYTGELVAFLLVLLIVALSVSIGLSRKWAFQRFARRIGVLNNLVGGLLGLVLAFLATVLAGMAITVFLHVISATDQMGSSPTVSDLGLLLSDSALVPMFAKLVPIVVAPLMPWFPSGMPSLLVSGS
jgi:uncharacterized membrane protein required for colicin V production